MEFRLPFTTEKTILALGAESSGGFCFLQNGKIFLSDDYGDLLVSGNYEKYLEAIETCMKNNDLKPSVVVHDLHPDYLTSSLAKVVAARYSAKLDTVQHHKAHIFSALGEHCIETGNFPARFVGIGADGTGLGEDGNVWGGEIFKIIIKNQESRIKRIGHLENQILIGGDLAIREPARILIAILSKFLSKAEAYGYVKEHYSENVFNLLWSQLEQDFNCFQTSSTGRILDAVSILLGFAGNERKYKHEPIDLLEQNSAEPFELESRIMNQESRKILDTTHLFKFLINNLDKDKQRLAATAQLYLAQGFYEMAKTDENLPMYFAGGMANNKIISSYMETKSVYMNKKIPRGDAGISFGQLMYVLLTDSRD